MTQRIHIIGIGDDGMESLTAAARALVDQAELLIGDEATLRRVPDGGKQQRIVVSVNPADALAAIDRAPDRRVVVLASGDPLFYGIARYLCDRLGKERFEVVPHVSSMQLAFARVKESWEDAYLANLATSPLERALDAIRVADKAGLFTIESCTPADVARALLARKIDYFHGYVCENLGSPDERVTQGELADLAEQSFAPLNVMVLVRKGDAPDAPSDGARRRLFGNPDDAFLQSRPKYGLLTPAEIRSIGLAQMDLRPDSVVWDIGAGSGSVAIEAAQIAREGRVYAIEMDPGDYELIQANARRFGVSNLTAILGRAPQAWNELPPPDCIFVGGSGRGVVSIVEQAYERLRPGGRIVVSVGSIENIAALNELLGGRTTDVQVWMINVARGTQQLERVRFEAINPCFLVAAGK